MSGFNYDWVPEVKRGFDTYTDLGVYYDFCIQLNAQRILDLGCGTYGISTLCFLKVCEVTGGEVVSVDINPGCVAYYNQPNWKFIQGDTQTVSVEGTFDVLSIDTSHEFAETLGCMNRFIPLLKTEGYLFMHDIWYQPIQLAIKEYIREKQDIKKILITGQLNGSPNSVIFIKL